MQLARKLRNVVGSPGTMSVLAAGLSALALLAAAAAESAESAAPATVAGTPQPASSQTVRYGRDIRPILSDRCFRCHGQDDKTRAAGLRLDVREAALAERDGAAAIVPGHPDQSELWRRVTSEDPDYHMPPKDSNKRRLSAGDRELIRQWIAEGAEYEPHWAFVPPAKPQLPAVRDSAWGRNEIDRFILSRLEEEGLKPSAEASPATLVRRVYLDLTGLPPTPEETDAFLADERPDAYEKLIERLLTKEPHATRYAERMAVPWMDQARYADTSGIHMDAGRQTWLWRDWVIEAFRTNMPFDEFLIEQLAGDLLPDATDQQKVASGFNRNHVTTDEGGAIDAEYLVEYAVDRTNTTGSVFLGLTVGCARCHEHKFDPISQQDYYRLYAFFNSNEEPGLYSQSPDSKRALEPFLVLPTAEQKAALAAAQEKLAAETEKLNARSPEEDSQREAFTTDTLKKLGLAWEPAKVTATESTGGATLTVQPDGSVLASGENPAKDEHLITLRTDGTGLRMLLIEAMTDGSLPNNRVGRAPNGNAVLDGVEAEAICVADPAKKAAVRFVWAWADVEQDNGDFEVTNVLDARDELGWAVDGHGREGGRVALLLADQPFGFEGGTDLRVRLRYNSVYGQHTLGRVRLNLARVDEAGFGLFPVAQSGWYTAGPFTAEAAKTPYETAFGPEQDVVLDLARKFGPGEKSWQFNAEVRDGRLNPLPAGQSVFYLGKQVFCPTARSVEVSLGSDDGFALFVNGKQVAAREISRGLAADQDKATIELQAGVNVVLLKIINTGAQGGAYYRGMPPKDELPGDLVAALLPEPARSKELEQRLHQAWKAAYSPGYRERKELVASLEKQLNELNAQAPRTMVMKEMAKPRETFVLTRGQYDKPDKNQPVTRAVPAAIGKLPEDVPPNRLGLARWLTSADNPLVARVAINRQWEMLFGTGIVQTSEDFGLQGEWPSHPELLNWLAVEFRESGWDVQHMLRLIMASSTYRQDSRVRPELHDIDPDNRLLAYYPRRRLAAEFVRDQALYVSGLLVEKVGGPSVKPYQPDGLWQEVAMIQSNTRIFERDSGESLWRKSLYTYWKRACPPPALLTFDAPTRESCMVRRSSTNTPLQALVLWNDEQYVEAARLLAQRTLDEVDAEKERLVRMFRRCTGRNPEDVELKRLDEALAAFRERYEQAPEDAAKLLEVGEVPTPEGANKPELAAWTMIANAMLNLSETITQR